MIVYNSTKSSFVSDVRNNKIADHILDCVEKAGINAGHNAEYRSWQNSIQFMCNIIDDKDINDDVNVAIEYEVPNTAKRVDFIISGADDSNHNNIVIVELKQWEKAEVVDDVMKHCVRTFVASADRVVSHPSYQAFSYASMLRNYSEEIEKHNVSLFPCAYLHNYEEQYRDQLANTIYLDWYTEAPFS